MLSSSELLNDLAIARLHRMGATDIQHDVAALFAPNQLGLPNLKARFGAMPVFVKVATANDFACSRLEQDWQTLYQTTQLADGFLIVMAAADVTQQAAALFNKVCGNHANAEFYGGVE